MATLTCLLPGSPCFDPADPISNVSSETEDAQDFLSRSRGSFGLVYGRAFIEPEGGTFPSGVDPGTYGTPGYGLPPLGSDWSSESCGGTCTSPNSQDDADLCAVNLGTDCLSGDPPQTIPSDGPNDCILQDGQLICFPAPDGTQPFTQEPRTIYGNEPQSCTVTCPDGSPFTYTLAANTVKASSQDQANLIGHSVACQRARQAQLCLSDLSLSTCCTGESYSGVITASSGAGYPFRKNLPITFIISSGSLPTGLVQSQSPNKFFIDGTTTVAGSYSFTVMATDSKGNVMSRVYTIRAVGIATTSLPNATAGSAYSATLSEEGPIVGTAIWTVFA